MQFFKGLRTFQKYKQAARR